MVIAIDIRSLLESEQTGVSVYTKELIDELVKSKNHQFILFYNSWHKIIPDFWHKENVVLRRFSLSNKFFNALQTIFSESYFDELIPEADYFLFPNLNFWNIKQKPYGMVIHDISFERCPEYFSLKSRWWHSAIGIKEKLNAARDIFAISEFTARDVADFYKIDEAKIKLVYPGLPSSARQRTSATSKPYFLFLARLEERKNVLAIIEAFLQLKEDKKCVDYKLILAGPKSLNGRYGQKISNLVKNKADIELAGFTTNEEKNNLLAGAKALVYPSFYEGFGFPPLEAQAVGVPVVASNVSSLPEIIGNSGLLIDPDRKDELAWAMNEVATNEETRKLLIARGLENVKRFKWSNTATTILNYILSSKS